MKKCSTLILSMLLFLQCFTLTAMAGEGDPSLSLAVSTPGFTEATPIPFGDKITLTYTATNCEDYFGDAKGGSITIYNGSDVVAENLTATSGSVTVTSKYATNTLTAKLFDGEDEICVSEPFSFTGTALYHNVTAPGVCRDFESGGGKWNTGSGTLDKTSALDYTYDNVHGKVAYAKWSTSHNNNRYESGNCLSTNVVQGRFFEVSADIKINRPNDQSNNIALLNVWAGFTNPFTGTTNKTHGNFAITFYLLKNGELACNNANNKTGITPTLNEWHNYKIICDTNPVSNGKASLYYYLDDVLIYVLNEASANYKSILKVNITPSFTVTSGSTDNGTEMWLDNVTLRTYDNVLTGTLSIGEDTTLTATEFENIAPKVTFNQPIDETTLNTMTLQKDGGGEVPFDGSYDATTRTYTMKPFSLEGNASYTLDLSGVAISETVKGYVGSEPATCAPVTFATMDYGFTASLTENGEAVTETTEVPYENAKFAITFDSEMNLETMKNMTLTASDNTSVTLNGTLSEDKKVYTFEPMTLQPNTDYTLRFSGVTTSDNQKGCKPISFTTKKGPAIVLSINTAGFNQNIPIPFGEKVQVTYTVDATPWLNGDTGSVAIYNGETQVAEGLEAKSGVIRIASQSENHTVIAKLLDDAGNVLYESNSVTFKGVSPETSTTGAGFCWDFDTTSGGKWNTPDGVTATTTSLKYYDDEKKSYVAYADWADTNANCRFESGKGIEEGTAGRFLEISADLKINRTNEGQNGNIGLFTTFYQTTGGSKTAAMLSIAKDGSLLCTGKAVEGIVPDWTHWHNYKVICDTAPENSTQTIYCFIDDVLVYCRKDVDSQYAKILKANIAPSHNLKDKDSNDIGSGVRLQMWMDNLTIRSYEEQFNATLSVNASDLTETPYETIAPTIAFTQAMDATTLTKIKLQDENGNEIALDEGTYDETQQIYTLPQLTLSPNTNYTILLEGVKTAKQAGGIITKLQFKTKKAPFSVRSVEEKNGQLVVTMNNESDKAQNAILIFGYFDAEKMIGGVTKNVSAVQNGAELFYTPTEAIAATTMESYLVELDTFRLIDECIVSIK